MYLRGLRHRSYHGTIVASVATKNRSNAAPFSCTSKWLREESTDGNPNAGSRSKNRNGSHYEVRKGSIRPFTVFVICLPLGFVLSWALNQRDAATSTSTADGFVKYTLHRREPVSSTCSIFTLRPTTSTTIHADVPASKGVITSVQFKQPQLQIARNYTLLPAAEGQDQEELSFLIRKERNGEVSGYLHGLPIGAEIELRGLNAEYVIPDKVDTVLFLAGGTGIAPAMQVADALAGKTNMHILWASRRREDCVGGKSDKTQSERWSFDFSGWWSPFSSVTKEESGSTLETSAIVSQLNHLKTKASSGHHRLLIDYYVDEEGTVIQPREVVRLISLARQSSLTQNGKRVLFISGPDGFVNHWAAPKQWVNGHEIQGPLGGILSTLDLDGWEVVKL